MTWKILTRVLLCLGVAVGVLIVMAVFLVVLPFLLLAGLRFLIAEAWFQFRLWLAGRIVRWEQAREQLHVTGGTLILEAGPVPGAQDRLWLLDERLAKLDPQAPWDGFAELERQVWVENTPLTTNDGFDRWCRTRLRRLARSAALVSFPSGLSPRQCLTYGHFPAQSVAVVLSPQMTTAVRHTFGRKRLTRA